MKGLLALLTLLAMGAAAAAQPYQVTVRSDIAIRRARRRQARRRPLRCRPAATRRRSSSRSTAAAGRSAASAFYRFMGPFLAKNGFARVRDQLPAVEAGRQDLPAGGLRREGRRAIRARQRGAARRRSRAHRHDGRFRRRASRVAGGARRRRAAVLDRISQRPARGDAGQCQGRGRLLRRLRHAGAVDARPARAAARPDHREVHRRAADGQTAAPISTPRR